MNDPSAIEALQDSGNEQLVQEQERMLSKRGRGSEMGDRPCANCGLLVPKGWENDNYCSWRCTSKAQDKCIIELEAELAAAQAEVKRLEEVNAVLDAERIELTTSLRHKVEDVQREFEAWQSRKEPTI